MDVHRCRFVPYPPSRINALAFSQTSGYRTSLGKSATTLRLAVGRGNGDIEIWNPLNGAWHHEITCRGGKDRSIDSLVWTQEPDEQDENGYVHVGRLRLFSSGHSSAVTEWDLLTGLPLRHSSGSHSEVWSLCAQPPWQPPKQQAKDKSKHPAREGEFSGQNLVAGCADGTLALLSTADDDLRFEKYVARSSTKKARAVSVTFQNRDIVVAGYADSTIRVYDTRNGSLLRSMSLGAGPKGGPKEILVWDVKCLPNGNIVSADSTGEVRFWDGRNYTELQRIKSHETDAVALVASADGETIFSGGLDRRTVLYRPAKNEGTKRRWAEFAHNRMHKHDISAMAAFDSGKMSIVVSGGVDGAPVIFPLREYGNENHRVLANLPQQPIVSSAPKGRLLISWWEREVHVWRINRQRLQEDSEEDGLAAPDTKDRRLVGRIALKGDENISSMSISEDGKLLAVSTAAEVKVFQLRLKKKVAAYVLRVRKLDTPQQLFKGGAKLVRISPDGKWLATISHNHNIAVARFVTAQDNARHVQVGPDIFRLKRIHRKPAKQNGLNGTWGSYDRSVIQAAFSTDSRIFAIGDLTGHIDSWVLHSQEKATAQRAQPERNGASTSASSDSEDDSSGTSNDSSDDTSDSEYGKQSSLTVVGERWLRNPSSRMLPKLPSAPLILSFKPSSYTTSSPLHRSSRPTSLPNGNEKLLALTAQHQLYVFEILDGKLSDWSRGNPTSSLPEDFKIERDRAMGCVWDVQPDRERVWLYGHTWLFMLDMAQDLRDEGGVESNENGVEVVDKGQGSKRKRAYEVEEMAERKRLRKGTSGAGSQVPEREKSGVGREMRKVIGGEDGEGQAVVLDRHRHVVSGEGEDEGDEYEEDDDAVPLLSKASHGEGQKGLINGTHDDRTMITDHESPNGIEQSQKTKNRPAWWMTHKYQPILGIAPLSTEPDDHDSDNFAHEHQRTEDDSDEDEQIAAVNRTDEERKAKNLEHGRVEGEAGPRPIEVVLVERPRWDVDLPPRFEGLHDVED